MNTELANDLEARWNALRENEPKLRIRDAAARLGVSEAELLATGCGRNVRRLQGPWDKLVAEFPRLGRVMCLTRNETAVHERHGTFREIDFFHGMGQVTGPEIDLRLFMAHWRHGFAVTDPTPAGERQSFQFFDADGTAVHKVYLQRESNYGAYGELLNRFRSPDQSPEQPVEAAKRLAPPLPDAEIDIPGFQAAWKEMNDTHAFFMILQKFRVGREQALRIAPEGFSKRLALDTPMRLLVNAANRNLPIMVFVGSPGCVQIHTGPVRNINRLGDEWLNVLDDDFNLHLNLPRVASAWLVRKPTTDGMITSVELFDAEGENVALFFGRRKPGLPEDENWRALAENLENAQ